MMRHKCQWVNKMGRKSLSLSHMTLPFLPPFHIWSFIGYVDDSVRYSSEMNCDTCSVTNSSSVCSSKKNCSPFFFAGSCHAAVMQKVLILIIAFWGVRVSCKSPLPTQEPNGTKEYCYSARIRSTVLQGLPFGGVPTVLALDFMCFLVSTCLWTTALLFMSTFLHKS